jgi:hypothetical protein
MNPFFCSLASYFFNSANSLAGIRYGLFDIGAIPGTSSMINLILWSKGIPGRSSGNTSGNSRTTLISSIGITFIAFRLTNVLVDEVAKNSTLVLFAPVI